eukprot:199086-Prymnesium_polylepis.1
MPDGLRPPAPAQLPLIPTSCVCVARLTWGRCRVSRYPPTSRVCSIAILPWYPAHSGGLGHNVAATVQAH